MFSYGIRYLVLRGALLILLWWLTGPSAGFAQEENGPRFELEHHTGDQGFTTVSLKQNGLALILQKERASDQRAWEITVLDSLLKQNWNTRLLLDLRLNLVGYEYTSNELFFLFRKGESDTDDFHLVRIFLFTHVIEQYTVTPKLDFKLTHFIVVGNSAIFGGYVTRQPAMLVYELATSRVHVVPGFFVDNTELLELKANGNGTFNALLIERGRKEQKQLLLKTFDATGSLLLQDDIEVDADRTILAGTTSTLENDELLLAGIWGQGPSQNKQASGLFSVLVDPFNKQPIQYQEFPELQHFLDFLPRRRAVKVRSKADRRRKAQKPPIYRVSVNVVRMEETARGFALLCEVYNPSVSSNYPYYNSNPYNSYNTPYGNPFFYGYSPYTYNPMTMNRYYNSPYSPYGTMPSSADVSVLHSSLVLFDREGKVKEDFALPIKDVKLNQLEQVSDFYISNKSVQFYKKESEVLLNHQGDTEETTEQDTVKIRLKSTLDTIRKEAEDQGGVRYWYGPYGYAWGYETIKNKTDLLSDPVRYVYYINKVRLD